jgi:hypothetical protein
MLRITHRRAGFKAGGRLTWRLGNSAPSPTPLLAPVPGTSQEP